MTIDISNNDPRISYSVAEGVTQTSFAVPFEFFDDSDVNVYVDGVLKTITTDYTISGGAGSTGTVTISVTGGSGGSIVVLTRNITIERTTDFTAGADINRAALNTQLDTLTAIAADVKDLANLALRYNDQTVGVSTEMPNVETLKGRTLSFNASTGAPEAGPTVEDVAGASGFASSASASATAAASSASNASSIETAAATSAAAAAASESAAATSETNAAASASSASTSASSASTSASSASSSATAAASAQTAAETARDQTLSAFDNFDDRYLGDKTSDPTTDNDGDPLVGGALYFNTTVGELRVWTGTTWVAAYGSLTGALLVANNLSDVQDAATSRTNLGLGTGDSPTFSGLTVNGNIAVTGTVDGRDIATDGTKLDGIEAGANLGATTGKAIAMAIVFGG